VKPSHDEAPELGDEGEALALLAELLNLAGEYFLRGPDPRLDALVSAHEWRANLRRAGLLDDTPDGRLLDAQDHERTFATLLRVPGGDFVPPFEQAYHASDSTGTLPARLACQRVYDTAGYEKAPFGSSQADHVGHELRFLGALAEREAECSRRGDADAARRVATWRRGFVRDRCSWWREFTDRLGDSTDCLQIRIMAALVRNLRKHLE
jgi:TorA maturation chaperone TorD